jgi:hypothetical protein
MTAFLQLNRRARARLHRATAALSLGIWLVMAAAEACPPLHAWLHGGSIPDDDHCAVVTIAHGKVEIAEDAPPVFIPITGIEIIPRAEISVFVPAEKSLPNDRAPPIFSAAS